MTPQKKQSSLDIAIEIAAKTFGRPKELAERPVIIRTSLDEPHEYHTLASRMAKYADTREQDVLEYQRMLGDTCKNGECD